MLKLAAAAVVLYVVFGAGVIYGEGADEYAARGRVTGTPPR